MVPRRFVPILLLAGLFGPPAFAEEDWDRAYRKQLEHEKKLEGALLREVPSKVKLGMKETAVHDAGFIQEKTERFDVAKWLKKYDSRTFGELIAQRLHVRMELDPCAGCAKYDKFSDSRILVHFHQKNFAQISKHGFRNLHQGGRSSGGTDKSARLDAEYGILGYMIGETVPTAHNDRYEGPGYKLKKGDAAEGIMPKYGYVELDSDIAFKSGRAYSEYGDVFAVLKPEVKRRTTWTVGDSVELTDRDYFNAHTFYGGELPENGSIGERYLEAQIWGELDLRDVEYFMIAPGTFEKHRTLVEAGLPVHEYGVEIRGKHGKNSREVHVKAKSVYAGDRMKMKAYAKSLARSRKAPKTVKLDEIRRIDLGAYCRDPLLAEF